MGVSCLLNNEKFIRAGMITLVKVWDGETKELFSCDFVTRKCSN